MIRNLGVAAYCLGWTLWFYRAVKGKTRQEVLAKSYFDFGKEMIADGDHIHVSGVSDEGSWGAVLLADCTSCPGTIVTRVLR